MHPTATEFLDRAAMPLGWYWLAVCALNVGAAWFAWRRGRGYARVVLWLAVAAVFGVLARFSLDGQPPVMPEGLKDALDAAIGPVSFTFGTLATLVILYLGRRFFVRPAVAWTGLNLALFLLGWSLTDPDFAATVSKPDNVPIVAMVFLLGFFTWLGASLAVRNARRLEQGRGPAEKDESDETLVWPDLVYIELICMVVCMAVLIVWSLVLKAPLEQPANPVVTPNPSKAPWYFLGLQEMLLFFDPWLAGVVMPGLIILGLMAIPYLDTNPEGNGYYTIRRRRFSYAVFQFGFLQLWILLILVGTFMRGPNWNFYGLYATRDPHQVLAQTNRSLSEYFWVVWLSRPMPETATDGLARLGDILWRESFGLVLVAGYFVVLPIVLGRTWLRRFRTDLGRLRYWIMVLLLLLMLTLPVKMILRWTFHLSYVVSMPEYYFSF